ncbi:Rho guanine nucleotide exchange factor [Paramarasmius palmivorus]|uniref:Rho guanine nucleotide exchange factor n=1 Tax=Paramarasmius palmivorus TaxID=297713 RepID=A0AAW0CXG2_9AGAR
MEIIQRVLSARQDGLLRLYLDPKTDSTAEPDKENIMIFLKYFNPTEKQVLGIGSARVSLSSKIKDFIPSIRERMHWAPQTPLTLYEEIIHRMIERMELGLSFAQSEIVNGDIICFEVALSRPEVMDFERRGLRATAIDFYQDLYEASRSNLWELAEQRLRTTEKTLQRPQQETAQQLPISDNYNTVEEALQPESTTILGQLEAILRDEDEYRNLVSQQGVLAQSLLDLLQMLSISPETSPTSNLYPQCLTIKNVKQLEEYPVDTGGFGEIWKGTVEGSSEIVCLKVVKLYQKSNVEKVLKRFLQEAIVWRQLEHPNLLPFLGLYFLDEAQQRLCLISPWMESGNLIQFLERMPRSDVDHRRLVWDVANGVKYLHQMKIIHADLKGVNILITKSGRATVGDFGLSYVADGEILRMTSSSALSGGTTRWLAPELLGSGLRPSYKSDIYAFGLVCYEIYTGLRPFDHLRYDAAVVLPVLQGTRPSRPDDMPELDNNIPDIEQVVGTLSSLFGIIESAQTWDSTVSKHIWVNAQAQDAGYNQDAVTFLSSVYKKLQER